MTESQQSLERADGETQRAPRRGFLRWLRYSAVLAVVLSVGVGALFGARLNRDPTLVFTPLIGQPASERTMPYLEQEGAVSLSDFRGQVVVVNFWASWCVACREEHPALNAAAAAYRDAGVQFIGVVYQDRPSSAITFLDEMGRTESYRYVTDPESRVAIDFGVFGVPETFFIDETGTIVAKITGASTLPLLSGVLDEILAGRTPTRETTVGPVQGAPGE
ncbi:redoxin family protein [Demequina sp. TTPB684]|uniref:TlpA family protein disulfide reductase n=1 Tax=unclassified Demequina TaxID=2620311 RepID=UPI001CF4DBF4|nr:MULTISPECIES: redoxin family protein [unclassified Demequina]MCB2412547.1 redoxin family protein [Demequina sp. TTPB684]UPU87805.1 redoxin family protein [Demequina sp. TMPB413]